MTAGPFGAPSRESLAGLVLELASQLHVERAQRMALQAALVEAGVLTPEAIAAAGLVPDTRARTGVALDHAMEALLRIMTEGSDPRMPLRGEGGNRKEGGE